MPLLNNAEDIRGLLKKLRDKKIAVPCFCTENTLTTEGILTGAAKVSQSLALDLLV